MLPLKRIRFGRPSRPLAISAIQWELPVALKADNGFLSLREETTRRFHGASRPFEALEPAQQRRLTVARLREQPSYPTMIILGVGRVDRDKAITLVEEDTAAGQQIVECERRVINRMRQLLHRDDRQPPSRKEHAHRDLVAATTL